MSGERQFTGWWWWRWGVNMRKKACGKTESLCENSPRQCVLLNNWDRLQKFPTISLVPGYGTKWGVTLQPRRWSSVWVWGWGGQAVCLAPSISGCLFLGLVGTHQETRNHGFVPIVVVDCPSNPCVNCSRKSLGKRCFLEVSFWMHFSSLFLFLRSFSWEWKPFSSKGSSVYKLSP